MDLNLHSEGDRVTMDQLIHIGTRGLAVEVEDDEDNSGRLDCGISFPSGAAVGNGRDCPAAT